METYVDEETKLEWTLDSFGPMPWEEAMAFCKNLGEGWQLPTIKELLSLVDYAKINSACKIVCNSSGYWSSTTYADYTVYAWRVNFHDGYGSSYSKSYSHYVRAVRSIK